MTGKINDDFAPYASPSSILSVIHRFRQTGLSWPLTKDEIQRVGISQSLATRTISALEFLNLIDKEGNRTDTINILGRATTEEYPGVFADILKDAYSDVFAILDPASATDTQFFDAFRTKTPEKQRSRMVSLFKGLCVEAGLMEEESPTKKEKPKRVAKNSSQKDEKKELVQRKTQQARITGSIPLEGEGSEYWYRKLEPLFTKLPGPSKPSWTKEDREKWHQALTALLDLYIPVKEEEDSQGGD